MSDVFHFWIRAAVAWLRGSAVSGLLLPVLLLSLQIDRAWGADILVAQHYIETPALMRFARSFRPPGVLAICEGALVAQSARAKITGCERERCPEDGCAPGQCKAPGSGWRQVEFYSDCGPSAFLLGFAQLKAGPVPAGIPDRERNRVSGHIEREGYRFRFAEHDYLVRTVMTNRGKPTSRARLEVLRDGKPYALLLEKDAYKMNCAPFWLGDLNGDGAPDVVVECFRNIYEEFSGLFLSREGNARPYEFIRQREVGGTL